MLLIGSAWDCGCLCRRYEKALLLFGRGGGHKIPFSVGQQDFLFVFIEFFHGRHRVIAAQPVAQPFDAFTIKCLPVVISEKAY